MEYLWKSAITKYLGLRETYKFNSDKTKIDIQTVSENTYRMFHIRCAELRDVTTRGILSTKILYQHMHDYQRLYCYKTF
jgi:type IV secretory pathway component VirB8